MPPEEAFWKGLWKKNPKKSEMILDFSYLIYIEYSIYVYINIFVTHVRGNSLQRKQKQQINNGLRKGDI
jgi:hypothetical protein